MRTPDGVPVEGARLEWADQQGRPESERVVRRTGADGRARMPHPIPEWSGAPYADHRFEVRAVHPAYGTGAGAADVRIARESVFATWAVEGAALVPELEGRVLVRVSGADGAPLAGREVELDAPRLGGRLTAMTDDDGVAILSGTVGAPAPGERCGGTTAAAAELRVGEHRQSLCLPVDPDATVAIRAAVTSPRRVEARLLRRPSVMRTPIALSALVHTTQGWVPVAQARIAARETSAAIALPDETRGEVWLRARAILSDAREVRGGGTLLWVGPTPSTFTLRADCDGSRAGDVAGSDTVAIFALEPAAASTLTGAVRSVIGPVGAALDEGLGEGAIRMLLASRTPRDESASAVLREGAPTPLPMPSEPARLGLLRDPWRTRARFVRGRIGRLMRAVEEYVAANVPGRLEDVAVRDARGHRFVTEILDAALPSAGVGGENAASLDGEPLDVAGLRAMDASFTYDNVARRITRERLWRLARMLRELVHDRELDLSWARRGDPSQYLVAMLEAGDVSWHEYPDRPHLFDAWGNPFSLRPVRGRARFEFMQPVPGWELVSAGPDGRFGTRDDMADPFARVLPSGGLYAEAVGEDTLLARLNGVALGRSMVTSLGALFGASPESPLESEVETSSAPTLPPPVRPARFDPVPVPSPRALLGGVGPATRTWSLPRERRRYRVVALRFSAASPPSSASEELVAGAPYAVRVELPEVMRPGETLTVPLAVIRLGDAPAPSVSVEAAGGALSIERADQRATLRAERAGIASVRIAVRAGEREVWSHEARIRVVPAGELRGRHASAFGAQTALSAPVPEGATPWRGRLIVRAPRSLASDPMFDALRASHPAPFAWAAALRGDDVDPSMLAALTRAAGPDGSGLSGVEAACALSAWASSGETGVPNVASALGRSLGDDLRDRAAVLAALAPAAPGVPETGGDPTSDLIVRLRRDGWRALATITDQPAVMARMAAALLVVDRQDAPGLALLERASAALTRDASGRRWLPGDAERPGDDWIGTLALAIAARQTGDDALADELAASAASRLYMAARTGVDGAFWAAAASVYGAFGVDAPARVELSVNGAARALELENGRAELALPAGSSVEVRGVRPVLARLESRFVAPTRARADGPLRTRIEGDPGRAGDRSALELVVEGSGAVGAPIVEITLPGGAELDAEAMASLRRSSAVQEVDPPDGAGVLRLHLATLAEGATHRLPLPWRWIASGRTRGLDVAAYDASRPFELTLTPGRTLEIAP